LFDSLVVERIGHCFFFLEIDWNFFFDDMGNCRRHFDRLLLDNDEGSVDFDRNMQFFDDFCDDGDVGDFFLHLDHLHEQRSLHDLLDFNGDLLSRDNHLFLFYLHDLDLLLNEQDLFLDFDQLGRQLNDLLDRD
jgi:hypothetical protein